MRYLVLIISFILFLAIGLLLSEIFVVLHYAYFFIGFLIYGSWLFQKFDFYFGKDL
ncbi:MAG: hypothetical protein L3J41_05910 [Melioribacteraceae bacterium]|nr:hypothetical protein [Melioribacteraceae bacterium]